MNFTLTIGETVTACTLPYIPTRLLIAGGIAGGQNPEAKLLSQIAALGVCTGVDHLTDWSIAGVVEYGDRVMAWYLSAGLTVDQIVRASAEAARKIVDSIPTVAAVEEAMHPTAPGGEQSTPIL